MAKRLFAAVVKINDRSPPSVNTPRSADARPNPNSVVINPKPKRDNTSQDLKQN